VYGNRAPCLIRRFAEGTKRKINSENCGDFVFYARVIKFSRVSRASGASEIKKNIFKVSSTEKLVLLEVYTHTHTKYNVHTIRPQKRSYNLRFTVGTA